MARQRRRSILSRIVVFKPGEAGIAFFFFLTFFLITAPYYIIKPIRNSSYLDQLGDERLPLAYFLTAVLMGFIVNFHSRLGARRSRVSLVVSTFLFFLSNICLFWWLFQQGWAWVPVLFWVWANIFAIVVVTQFWLLVNDVFNPREAKRLIGFIGSGGQLGAILGSLLVGVLATTKAFTGLLLIAAAFLFLAILAVFRIFNWQRSRSLEEGKKTSGPRESAPAATTKVGFRDALETTRKSVYLRLLAGIMLATLIVSTLVDWQFNSVVKNRVAGGGSLASFFGYFNAGTMTFAFLFQLLLTSPVIRRFGIRLSLLIYPIILILSSAGMGIVAYASIIPAILIKASDKSLAYSLNQSVRELLYIPIAPEEKSRSKTFIDMFVNRFAKGLGAVILWILLLVFPKSTAIRAISLVAGGAIVLWAYLNLRVGREYANLVKEKLELKWERGDKLVAEKLDVDFAKLVFDTLESRNRSSVLYALHLFDLIRQDKLTPEVRKLINYKADEVRASSLGTLFEQTETGLGPTGEEELLAGDMEKEVAEIMALDVYQEVVKNYFDKTLVDRSEAGAVARMEAAKAIGLMAPHAPAVEKLADLLEDDSPEVVRYAMESAGVLKRREDIPLLVDQLKNPVLCEDASASLVRFGPKIVGTLADYLADPKENLNVRQAVATVLARLGTQEAVDFLAWELASAEGELAAAIIDSLDRLRGEHAELTFPEYRLRSRLRREVLSLCSEFVRQSECPLSQRGGSNIFKLLGLLYSHEDMTKAYQNLKTGTKDSVAYALELLDNILEKGTRDLIFPLVEDISLEERMRRCQALLESLSAPDGESEKGEEEP